MLTFEYGDIEINHLKSRDKLLGKVIDEMGSLKYRVRPDIFEAIVHNIIGQQISDKSAATVWGKLQTMVEEVTAENIFKTSVEDIQKCGMSMRKAGYIKGVSSAVVSKEIDIDNLGSLSDEEVIKVLTSLNGVGIWTVEMILLFSMQRPNVLSYGDLVIRKAIMNLHNLENLSKKDFEEYKELYSPYCSVASLYLWSMQTSLRKN